MIGKRLRQLREDAGLTQRELAIRAGVLIKTISELERDVNDNPELRTLQAIAGALGKPVAELLEAPSPEPAGKAVGQ